MKKIINFIVAILIVGTVNAQWSFKTVSNGFDDPYKIAYTPENNGAAAYMLFVDSTVVLSIDGGYYCEEKLIVDISFMVNGTFKKYVEVATVSESNDIVWINDDLMNSEMINDFKSCSLVKLRVNDAVCDSETYSFSMSGSTSAIIFINK